MGPTTYGGPIALTMGNPKPPPLDPQPAFLLNIAGLRPAMLRRGPKARDAFTTGRAKSGQLFGLFLGTEIGPKVVWAKSRLGQKSTGQKW